LVENPTTNPRGPSNFDWVLAVGFFNPVVDVRGSDCWTETERVGRGVQQGGEERDGGLMEREFQKGRMRGGDMGGGFRLKSLQLCMCLDPHRFCILGVTI